MYWPVSPHSQHVVGRTTPKMMIGTSSCSRAHECYWLCHVTERTYIKAETLSLSRKRQSHLTGRRISACDESVQSQITMTWKAQPTHVSACAVLNEPELSDGRKNEMLTHPASVGDPLE
jgi:hypothetical protein